MSRGRTLFTAAAARESRATSNTIAGHLARAIECASRARADYAEGDLASAHEDIKKSLDELSIAEAMLASQLFIEGESV